LSTPYAFLPYQIKWAADRTEVKVWEKSRRVGASWCEAEDSTNLAAKTKGMDTWYIGYNKDMAEEFIRDVAFWARVYNHAASEMEEEVIEDEDKDILTFKITFASGWRVTALSSRPANLRGKKGKVVIDEAAFHDDLEGLLKAALALIIWGGRVVVLSTHFGDANPFNELVQDCRAKKLPYSLHRTTFEDACAEGLGERVCLHTGVPCTPETLKAWKDKIYAIYAANAAEELGCIPSGGTGIYFSRALVESIMDASIPVIRYSKPDSFAILGDDVRFAEVEEWLTTIIQPHIDRIKPGSRFHFGWDFGRNNDLSSLTPLIEDQCLKGRVPFILELRNIPFKQQEQILFFILDRVRMFISGAMDSRGNGQYLGEVTMQRYGAARIAQVMLTAEWYRENMPRYKAAMEDKNFITAKDADVLNDHRSVQVVKGVPKVPDNAHTKGSDGGNRHGDSAVSGCLAWFAKGMEAGPIEYQTVGPERESYNLSDYTG
jgi:phage FluMu gp28-like protein